LPRSRPPPAPARRARRRLAPEARRRELLDAAAAIVQAEGARGLPMERLAERAGVSKGLGYAYFANGEELALALHDRELGEVYRRVEAATADAPELDSAVARAVAAYFDVVAERGALLGSLQARLDRTRLERRSRERVRAFVDFWSAALGEAFPRSAPHARLVAGMLLGAADTAARAWRRGGLSRAEAESLCVGFLRGGLAGAADATEGTADAAPAPAGRRTRSGGHPGGSGGAGRR